MKNVLSVIFVMLVLFFLGCDTKKSNVDEDVLIDPDVDMVDDIVEVDNIIELDDDPWIDENDEDLQHDDDLIQDNEGESNDTNDLDPDIDVEPDVDIDADIDVDGDIDEGDPCQENPCVMLNSNGVCTVVEGNDYTCGCDNNYSWNGVNKKCDPDTKRIPCVNSIPLNSEYSGGNSDSQFEQTWDGDSWEPTSFDCAWECKDGWVSEDEETCIFGKRMRPCENIPENGHGSGANASENIEQIWDGDSWEPSVESCEWECDTSFHTEDNLTCISSYRYLPCENIPADAHGIDLNNDGTFEQIWDGDSWEPSTFECSWECDLGYLTDGTGNGCVFQPIIYVDVDAIGANTGYSWEDAFTSLHTALERTVATQEVWIASGVYKPEGCPKFHICASERYYHFGIYKDVDIFGGFAGTETSVDQRDLDLNMTILSGDVNDNDTWNDTQKKWENRSDNVFSILKARYGDEVTKDTVLDGVIVVGGHSDVVENGKSLGAGINLLNNSLTVKNTSFIGNYAVEGGGAINAYPGTELVFDNCIFDRNIADPDEAVYTLGGGIKTESDKLTIIDSTFTGNRAKNGGAVYAPKAEIIIENTEFYHNFGSDKAGAISAWNSGSLVVKDSTFEENTCNQTSGSDSSGAVINFSGGVLEIRNSTFSKNASEDSGVMDIEKCTSVVIDQCEFIENVVDTSASNAIISINESTVTISDSVFKDNSGTSLGLKKTDSKIMNSTFEGNTAREAAAIDNGLGNIEVIDTFFIGNSAIKTPFGFSGIGGAILLFGIDESDNTPQEGLSAEFINTVFMDNTAEYWGSSLLSLMFEDLSFINCTFYNNKDENDHGVVLAESTAKFYNTIHWDKMGILEGTVGLSLTFGESFPEFKNSDISGCGGSTAWDSSFMEPAITTMTSTAIDLGNNIDEDPLFNGIDPDPLFLLSGSQCINAGDNSLLPISVTTDILGNLRVEQTTVDIGAYEYFD